MITQITTMTELKNKDITEKIMGASFEVHKFLGNACRQGRAFRKQFINGLWLGNYPMQDYPLPGKLNRAHSAYTWAELPPKSKARWEQHPWVTAWLYIPKKA